MSINNFNTKFVFKSSCNRKIVTINTQQQEVNFIMHDIVTKVYVSKVFSLDLGEKVRKENEKF